MSETNQLPAGYVLLNGAAMHVAKLRQHTTDVQRFLKYAPVCQELEELGAGSDRREERMAAFEDNDLDAIVITFEELADVHSAFAKELCNDTPPQSLYEALHRADSTNRPSGE